MSSADGYYRDLFEQAVEGMFVTSPEGRYLAVNGDLDLGERPGGS